MTLIQRRLYQDLGDFLADYIETYRLTDGTTITKLCTISYLWDTDIRSIEMG